jgi:hypothetical protein
VEVRRAGAAWSVGLSTLVLALVLPGLGLVCGPLPWGSLVLTLTLSLPLLAFALALALTLTLTLGLRTLLLDRRLGSSGSLSLAL